MLGFGYSWPCKSPRRSQPCPAIIQHQAMLIRTNVYQEVLIVHMDRNSQSCTPLKMAEGYSRCAMFVTKDSLSYAYRDDYHIVTPTMQVIGYLEHPLSLVTELKCEVHRGLCAELCVTRLQCPKAASGKRAVVSK